MMFGYYTLMNICQPDWERVVEKARDITSATESRGDPMYEVHVEGMMRLLDELEAKYGPQSEILATRADYLDDFSQRRTLLNQALELAKSCHDTKEIEEIMDSIRQLDEEKNAEQTTEAGREESNGGANH